MKSLLHLVSYIIKVFHQYLINQSIQSTLIAFLSFNLHMTQPKVLLIALFPARVCFPASSTFFLAQSCLFIMSARVFSRQDSSCDQQHYFPAPNFSTQASYEEFKNATSSALYALIYEILMIEILVCRWSYEEFKNALVYEILMKNIY